jgi:hypothetical protein
MNINIKLLSLLLLILSAPTELRKINRDSRRPLASKIIRILLAKFHFLGELMNKEASFEFANHAIIRNKKESSQANKNSV